MLFSRKNPPDGYYVYFYLRDDGTPYYCGKGKGPRAWKRHRVKNKSTNRYSGVHIPKDDRILIVHHGLTLVGSLAIERRYIRWYGRKDLGTGILHNKTDGGDGGDNPSPANRALKAKNNSEQNRGKTAALDIKTGKCVLVQAGDVGFNNGSLVGLTKGRVTARYPDGRFEMVSVDDERLLSGELVHSTKGKIPVRDSQGNTFQIDKSDPMWISGELVGAKKGVKLTQSKCPGCGKMVAPSRWHPILCSLKR
jgi:hypothetical protein